MNRLIGNLPVIGIRPVIDGRRDGVRESLEQQTMTLALNLKKWIEANFYHISGEKVECVIPDFTIGGIAEAARCASIFEKHNLAGTITVTPCWCYGTETMDLTPLIPKAIWGFNGTERPGAVYLAASGAAHDQLGDPVFTIYGRDVQDADDTSIPADVKVKMARFIKAAIGVRTMYGKSYLSLGSVSMGIAGSVVNQSFFHDYLGMRNEYVDMSELIRRMDKKIYDEHEFTQALSWVKKYCPQGIDTNKKPHSRAEHDSEWQTVVKMTLIMRDLMIGNRHLAKIGYAEEAQGHNSLVLGFQGQRQWTDFMPNGDFSEAILNSSFDWNGVRQAFIVATENDSLNGASMLLNHLVSYGPQIFADVRTFWSPEAIVKASGKPLTPNTEKGLIHLKNSGSTTVDAAGEMHRDGKPVMKPFWEISDEEAKACLAGTKWCPANLEYFRGGGFSSQFVTKGPMPITMTRINLIKGIGPILQIAEGMAVEIDKGVHKILDDRTDKTWPTTWFVPRITSKGAFKDVYSVMDKWGANHGAISYGHIGADLITLASMLRIPVAMHNVAEEDIFRPKAWSNHGTKDNEAADYRACANYGPLYK